jgi:hypothetical protein
MNELQPLEHQEKQACAIMIDGNEKDGYIISIETDDKSEDYYFSCQRDILYSHLTAK